MRTYGLVLGLVCGAALAACSGGGGGGPERGTDTPLSGSCEPTDAPVCGGQSEGGCWCDDECAVNGDCCFDVADYCGVDPDPDPGLDPVAPLDVPDTAHCSPAADWPMAYRDFEDEVVALTNEVRAEGRDCGTEGSFPPAPPVVANEELRCAARLHALDMDANDFFAHVTPAGLTIGDRVTAAGYSYSVAAENLADGPLTPDAVMAGWLASDGHCANIMAADVVDLGAAFLEGGTHGTLWVQKFASP